MKLTNEEINRYARHLTLPEVGMAGQLKFKAAKILLIGAGGLGSPLGMYLGAAGIGKLGIVDFDVVDSSNLQRQIAHRVADVGRPKVESIKATILAGNPEIEVEIHDTRLSRDNVLELFNGYDLVVDGSDNFETRYLVNDAAFFTKKPLVYGSIFKFQGQITVFNPHEGGPCYRCLYASPPPAALVPS
ncbi:MAG: ThiF family adenylyltransferase [SAR324 cluster bacterium]|nr:ThiF family adenylyltransferase [SAR324 cluster bacterium]